MASEEASSLPPAPSRCEAMRAAAGTPCAGVSCNAAPSCSRTSLAVTSPHTIQIIYSVQPQLARSRVQFGRLRAATRRRVVTRARVVRGQACCKTLAPRKLWLRHIVELHAMLCVQPSSSALPQDAACSQEHGQNSSGGDDTVQRRTRRWRRARRVTRLSRERCLCPASVWWQQRGWGRDRGRRGRRHQLPARAQPGISIDAAAVAAMAAEWLAHGILLTHALMAAPLST